MMPRDNINIFLYFCDDWLKLYFAVTYLFACVWISP
jgi:hypothetical protein